MEHQPTFCKIVCGAIAALLPHVMTANLQAIQNRQPDSSALQRYDETARTLLNDITARAADGVQWIQRLCTDLHIPPLRTYGFTAHDISSLVQKASAASSMKPNPIALTADELGSILKCASVITGVFAI